MGLSPETATLTEQTLLMRNLAAECMPRRYLQATQRHNLWPSLGSPHALYAKKSSQALPSAASSLARRPKTSVLETLEIAGGLSALSEAAQNSRVKAIKLCGS